MLRYLPFLFPLLGSCRMRPVTSVESAMSSGTVFRPATRDDAREIAELFGIASGGVAE